MDHLARSRTDRSKNLVGFVVGDVRYAIDIQRTKEIINPLHVVALPHAPKGVVGVADHRGDVVPVIDLRERFGLATRHPTRRTKWVVVETGDRAVGLVVDAVTDVFGAGKTEQRKVPDLGAENAFRGIAAVYRHQGRLVFVIDVDQVVEPAEELDMEDLRNLLAEEADQ